MKEIIIIKTDQGEKIKNFLEKEKFSYEIYQEPKPGSKTDIFANYGEAIKDKEREAELKLWDNVDADEELNEHGEWWN